MEVERKLAPQPLGCRPYHPSGRRRRRMRSVQHAHPLSEMSSCGHARAAAALEHARMTRKPFLWKLKDRELHLGERTLIMGVLNVTPDSFSDGGKHLDPDRAFARAIELEE